MTTFSDRYPKLEVWVARHKLLEAFAKDTPCDPADPPILLILAGWAYSSNAERIKHWNDTVEWAEKNGCSELVTLSDNDYSR